MGQWAPITLEVGRLGQEDHFSPRVHTSLDNVVRLCLKKKKNLHICTCIYVHIYVHKYVHIEYMKSTYWQTAPFIENKAFCAFVCFVFFFRQSHNAVLAGLKVTEILLPLPPECWEQRHAPHPALHPLRRHPCLGICSVIGCRCYLRR